MCIERHNGFPERAVRKRRAAKLLLRWMVAGWREVLWEDCYMGQLVTAGRE